MLVALPEAYCMISPSELITTMLVRDSTSLLILCNTPKNVLFGLYFCGTLAKAVPPGAPLPFQNALITTSLVIGLYIH